MALLTSNNVIRTKSCNLLLDCNGYNYHIVIKSELINNKEDTIDILQYSSVIDYRRCRRIYCMRIISIVSI